MAVAVPHCELSMPSRPDLIRSTVNRTGRAVCCCTVATLLLIDAARPTPTIGRMHGPFVSMVRTLSGLLACCGLVLCQDGSFASAWNWRWSSPDVLCGASDAAGTIAAYGTVAAGDGAKGWELVLYDPGQRRELRRVPLTRRPFAMRFRDAEHVEVGWPDDDSMLSLSHWHRVRCADGVEVGATELCRVEGADAEARARFRGRKEIGIETGLRLDKAGGLSWWQRGQYAFALTDRWVYGIAWTADARFVIVWLPTRLVAVAVADGQVKQLPIRSDDVRVVLGGGNGDEVLVVAVDGVRLFRASTGAALRTVPCAVDPMFAAALAPGGNTLAIARGEQDDVLLLDLRTGRTTNIDMKARDVAWSPDGRLACVGSRGFVSFDGAGRPLWNGSARVWSELQLDDPPKDIPLGVTPILRTFTMKYTARWRLLALDGEADAYCFPYRTYCVVHGAAKADLNAELCLWGSLGPRELVATKYDNLLLCDAAWQPMAHVDAGAPIETASVARAARCVAVVAGADLKVYDILPRVR